MDAITLQNIRWKFAITSKNWLKSGPVTTKSGVRFWKKSGGQQFLILLFVYSPLASHHLKLRGHRITKFPHIVNSKLLDDLGSSRTGEISFFFSRFFMWFQQFTLGFRLGLFQGHLMIWKFCLARTIFLHLDVWQRASSFRKYVHPWMSMNCNSWSPSTVW